MESASIVMYESQYPRFEICCLLSKNILPDNRINTILLLTLKVHYTTKEFDFFSVEKVVIFHLVQQLMLQ